jgi:putative transposase
VQRDDEDLLTRTIIDLATEYGRYGYRWVTTLLRQQGWAANDKRVERIWRREGLKVPQKQPKRARLWLNDGSCIRLRAAHRTHDGKAFRMLTVIDEYTHECLAIKTLRQQNSTDVLECLGHLVTQYGVPEHIRSDNGAKFTAMAVREWLAAAQVKTLFIEPGSP